MKNFDAKEIITEAVLGFLNDGDLNDVEKPVNKELTEEEKKKEWFKKLVERVNHKNI